tara:strand:- start:1671 stop:2513 length:843 start_codon:yes stop_codon:yes gene_type:complete
MNRRGSAGEKLMVFPFFFIMVMIGIGIVAGVYVFFGDGYDARGAEARVFGEKLRDCLNDDFNEIDWSGEVLRDLSELCGFNENVVEEHFVVGILKDERYLFRHRNPESCRLEGAKGNDGFPRCVEIELRGGISLGPEDVGDRYNFVKNSKETEVNVFSKSPNLKVLVILEKKEETGIVYAGNINLNAYKRVGWVLEDGTIKIDFDLVEEHGIGDRELEVLGYVDGENYFAISGIEFEEEEKDVGELDEENVIEEEKEESVARSGVVLIAGTDQRSRRKIA